MKKIGECIMFCKNCGAQNAPEDRFCKNCGSPLQQGTPAQQSQPVEQVKPPVQPTPPAQPEPPAQPSFSTQPAPSAQQNQQVPSQQFGQPGQQPMGQSVPPQAAYQANQQAGMIPGVRETVQKLGSSPVFLIAVICFTASLILNLIASFIGNNGLLSEVFGELNDELGIGGYAGASGAAVGTVVSTIIFSLLPGVLICIGMWMFYNTCKNWRGGYFSTGGLTMIRVISIILLVLCCIFFAFMIVLMFVLLITPEIMLSGDHYYQYSYGFYGFGNSYYESEIAEARAVFAIVLILFILAFVFVILYFAKLLKTIRTVSDAAAKGIASDKVSVFVAVMNIIAAVSTFGSSFASNVAGMFGGWCSAAAMILTAVLIFQYQSQIRRMMMPQIYQQMN